MRRRRCWGIPTATSASSRRARLWVQQSANPVNPDPGWGNGSPPRSGRGSHGSSPCPGVRGVGRSRLLVVCRPFRPILMGTYVRWMRTGIDASSGFCSAGSRKSELRTSSGSRGTRLIALPRAWDSRRGDEGTTPTTGRQSAPSTTLATVRRRRCADSGFAHLPGKRRSHVVMSHPARGLTGSARAGRPVPWSKGCSTRGSESRKSPNDSGFQSRRSATTPDGLESRHSGNLGVAMTGLKSGANTARVSRCGSACDVSAFHSRHGRTPSSVGRSFHAND